MAKTKKERLEQDALKADRINQTLRTSGWNDILGIIQDQYNSAMSSLLEKENPEARGAVNALIEVMNAISTELQFGESARKKFQEQFASIQTP